MQIKDGASVYGADGQEVGKVDRVVMDPRTNEITHLVVRKGWLFSEDRVVPIDLVEPASDERVLLRHDVQNLDDLPLFEETHYVARDAGEGGAGGRGAGMADEGVPGVPPVGTTMGPGAAGFAPGLYWYPPMGAAWPSYYAGGYGRTASNYVGHTEQNIPEGTVGLKEGADVISADGEHVGTVKEVITNAEVNRATHMVISEGWLFKEKRAIPVDWIREVGEDSIRLGVEAHTLRQIPA